MGSPSQNRTEIERLRQELEAETGRCIDLRRQLDRASAEFGEFISIAAHNLREPLRDMACFSQLIAENHAAGLDPEAGVFLGRIQEGAQRMQSLLADVVDYWANCGGGFHSSRTEMEAALGQATLYAGRQIAERSATVTHDPLPPVIGDFEIVTKVLHHLVRNAIEYSAAAPPRVHISCTRMDPHWVFSVEDNGPGIELEFQGRIFGVFKRLHGKEYPGSGLGLAFCKKAIEWHGGRIWMESTPGSGSTFYFTMPAAD
jgi:light-regulated signal transduction histidine kinase (bacteriophytochrome)